MRNNTILMMAIGLVILFLPAVALIAQPVVTVEDTPTTTVSNAMDTPSTTSSTVPAMIVEAVIALLSTLLTYFVGKYLHWQIEQEKVSGFLWAIARLCINVEQTSVAGVKGNSKMQTVINMVKNRVDDPNDKVFTKGKVTLLKKVFGSLEVAVERAFQLTQFASGVKGLIKH